ncbi:MAG: amidase domain-containing protein [Clostridium sp.]
MPNRYNREAAVSYAIKYAIVPNSEYKYYNVIGEGGGDCTNFISQCLKAGGAPMDYNNLRPWWYDMKQGKASICWAVAHSLYWYLKTSRNNNKIKGREVDDIRELEMGDLIFYENYNNVIFHSTIITSFAEVYGNREPRISQHTSNQLNVTYKKSYDYKKAHFIKIILT